MLKKIDTFLNQITMYRLALYCLLMLWGWGFALSILGWLGFSPVDYAVSGALIFLACLGSDFIFSRLYRAPANTDSTYITAIILALIVSPANPVKHISFLLLAAALAVASKYVLAFRKKHLFNPAALGAVAAAIITGQYASWWVGTAWMLPAVLITGLLIVRKLQRWDAVGSFLAASALLILGHAVLTGQQIAFSAQLLAVDSPWLFLSFVMLTEPATMPPRRVWRVAYGVLVGILFVPFVSIFNFFFSPEQALLVGNLFSFIVSPKGKLILKLKERMPVAKHIENLIFETPRRLVFRPGQYLEWTLAHGNSDNRGIRRYFTIASSPTEKDLIIGVRFYEKSSSYKQALEKLQRGDSIVAGQLAGDFTLPIDSSRKLAFLAGGIGVTPFRSMAKYLIDRHERRDIVMLYSVTSPDYIAYRDIFEQARTVGLKTSYLSEIERQIATKEFIAEQIPDYHERLFYISGPRAMVDHFKGELEKLGIAPYSIKTDFFPGFA